jgi:energy-coupling factor transporter ATP-binding protein EcfA2
VALLHDIANWLDDQPDWVSDAARRIMQNGTLAETDIDDLAALLLDSVGLPDLVGGRTAVRLDVAAIPAEQPEGAAVSLTGIRNPVRINALSHPDGISFEAQGLTIVYGYNGAGKSGFARALKSACRARDRERVLPDVFDPPDPPAPAKAMFRWRTPTGDFEGEWIDGNEAHPDLSAIAVFDSRCARLLVDDENEVAVVPYGLDILRELVRGFDLVRKRIETERGKARFDVTLLAPLNGTTMVGKVIAALEPKTDPQSIKTLASLSPEDAERRMTLGKMLGADDPAKQATVLRRSAQRIATLLREIATLRDSLGDGNSEALRNALATFVATEQASKIAAEELSEGGTALKGTGTDPWKELVESAMRFAQAGPYPDEPYPSAAADAKCVLCQQPLLDVARARLTRFAEFLAADAQKKAAEARNVAAEIFKGMSGLRPDEAPTDKTIIDEIRERNAAAADAVHAYLSALAERKGTLSVMAKDRVIGDLAALPDDPTPALTALKARLDSQATILEKVMTPEERKARSGELAELDARAKLAEMLALVLKAVEAAKTDAIYADAVRQTDTRGLTRKVGELQEKAVSAGLTSALDAELKALGLTGMNVNLELRGSKGAGLQRLRLDLPKSVEKMKLSDVLSEGEQRAIAIASFLAETGLSHSKSGIVFDDPVSSLDHSRRDAIAKRLAKEAAIRQVIVFTHDLVFVWDLVDGATNAGVPYKGVHVFSSQGVKGLVKESLPHEGGKLDARLNDIRSYEKKARKAIEQDIDHEQYDLFVRRGYGMLRDCWERLIEEVLFGDTVRRFRNGINTKNLKKAHVDDNDFEAVWHGMTRCSCFTHDAPTDAVVDLPDPDGFLADIERFAAAYEKAKTSTKETEKRRTETIPAAR